MSAREIEAARVALTRYLKRGGKVWIRIFPDKPLTKKAARNPYGKGQRRAGNVGCRGAARADFIRNGRRRGSRSPRKRSVWRRISFRFRPSMVERRGLAHGS